MKIMQNVRLLLALGGACLWLNACAEVKAPQAQTKAAPALTPAVPRWSPAEYAALAQKGEGVFQKFCARCHTVDGTAHLPATDLSDFGSEQWTHQRVVGHVEDPNRTYPGTAMPAFGAAFAQNKEQLLVAAQIDEVTAYIRSLHTQAGYLQELEEAQK